MFSNSFILGNSLTSRSTRTYTFVTVYPVQEVCSPIVTFRESRHDIGPPVYTDLLSEVIVKLSPLLHDCGNGVGVYDS